MTDILDEWDMNERKARDNCSTAYHCYLCGRLAFTVTDFQRLQMSKGEYDEHRKKLSHTHHTKHCHAVMLEEKSKRDATP